MIGWLLDTNVTAEIISACFAARVKAWAAKQDEATLYLSILTIAEYDKGIANLPDGDARRPVYMTTRDSLAARFAGRLLPVSEAVVRRWGTISGTVRRDTGHPPPVIDTLLAARPSQALREAASGDAADVAFDHLGTSLPDEVFGGHVSKGREGCRPIPGEGCLFAASPALDHVQNLDDIPEPGLGFRGVEAALPGDRVLREADGGCKLCLADVQPFRQAVWQNRPIFSDYSHEEVRSRGVHSGFASPIPWIIEAAMGNHQGVRAPSASHHSPPRVFV